MIRFALAVLLLSSVGFAGVTADSATLEKVAETPGMPDGPAWDRAAKRLIFSDVKQQQLYTYDPATGKTELKLDQAGRISAVFIDSQNRLWASDHANQRIVLYDAGGTRVIADHQPKDAKPKRGTNDLVVDRRGGMYHTVTATGEVFYTPPRGDTRAVVAGLVTPNGLILSPDGKTLYVAAYVPKQIWAYPVSSDGSVGNPTLFATMDEGPEKGADGMAIDTAGNVYCAGPADIWVWSSRGELIEKIPVPMKPINCTFGDADGKSLYITAGPAVYRIRMNVAGF